MRPPLFEVTVAAANAAARRLTTAANVNVALKQGETVDQALIESKIDYASAMAASYCKLARAGATPPTFGAETLRATFFAEPCYQRESDQLVLPWRAPIASISSVVENGTTLTEGTDFELLAGGLLHRLESSTSAPRLWAGGKIVVVYVAGWTLPADVPAEIEGQIIEQVKLAYLGTNRDPALRTETIVDVSAEEFNVAGGSSIGRSGLLVALEDALAPFRDWSQG